MPQRFGALTYLFTFAIFAISTPGAVAPTHRKQAPKPAPPQTGDLGAVKQALEFVRKGKIGQATVVKNMLDDEAAQKLIEWFVLRHPNSDASFRRYAAFIDENPDWPS